MKNEIPDLLRSADVPAWDDTADVVVIGYGISGACAALEARGAGADVLVLERASGGGGASALSAGIFYLGGGTGVQKAVGCDDDADWMYRFLMASTHAPDPRIVRRFCDDSVAHFDWLEEQGVPFERSWYKDKAVIAPTSECLASTGNEKVWPYFEIAPPVPRGPQGGERGRRRRRRGDERVDCTMHRCGSTGALRQPGERPGARRGRPHRGRARARDDRKPGICAPRRGVVLAAGGFSMNRELMRRYGSRLPETAEPLGIPNNDGDALLLGLSAGAATQAMDGSIATASLYPPAQLVKGILVNKAGQRFVAEDSYHGRTAECIAEQPDAAAYLIVDGETFAYPETAGANHRLVDGWETVAEMEAGLGLPAGSLERTLAEYNEAAARGEDPLLHKHADWLKPLDQEPYAAFDVSYSNSTYAYLTLGGLKDFSRRRSAR